MGFSAASVLEVTHLTSLGGWARPMANSERPLPILIHRRTGDKHRAFQARAALQTTGIRLDDYLTQLRWTAGKLSVLQLSSCISSQGPTYISETRSCTSERMVSWKCTMHPYMHSLCSSLRVLVQAQAAAEDAMHPGLCPSRPPVAAQIFLPPLTAQACSLVGPGEGTAGPAVRWCSRNHTAWTFRFPPHPLPHRSPRGPFSITSFLSMRRRPAMPANIVLECEWSRQS